MKKCVSSILSLSLLLGGVSVVNAAEVPSVDKAAHAKASKPANTGKQAKAEARQQHLDKIKALAEKWGIDTTNMTVEQMKEA